MIEIRNKNHELITILPLDGLQGAYLQGAYLQGANLQGENLQGAYLRGANLQDANLIDVNFGDQIDLIIEMTSITPKEGSFIGWKKCRNSRIVKLLIPENAKRSNATGRKCRASHALVLDILTKMGDSVEVATSLHNPKFEYKKGEIVECDEWEDDRWVECSGGIHFYMTREEAENHFRFKRTIQCNR